MKKYGWNITENFGSRSPYKYRIRISKVLYDNLNMSEKKGNALLSWSLDIMAKKTQWFISFKELSDALEWAEENAR